MEILRTAYPNYYKNVGDIKQAAGLWSELFADDDLILSISLDTIYAKNFSKFLLIPPKYPRSVSGVDIWAGGLRCGV